ncbi:malate dehydrogenase [Lysinibacillus irui]|uniref:Malate dehydrogenase n=1 Tax=Lysinibacillus irui TaxID=2998077 RepID=A0ABU5NNQ8_9BACI|nr:malate dehydrogenase [Lysinibacillus irui]MEA0555313.1 malate dehydrogenase [Lysinibacillus irui]MEA0977679.1 malate dehydrogenase [Lysinibacillus irui]MEA1043833.1 malate dehydrogenase [Lysinibacillus irui]
MSFRRPRIAIIGAGHTGATIALMVAQKEMGDIVLVDVPELENTAKGKALDILQAGPIEKSNVQVTATSRYEEIAHADIVVITAGIARKPGMTREDLIHTNASIIRTVSEQIKYYAPASYIIVLSNPVDAMTYVCLETTGFPKNRVMGQSGILDTARFNTFIAQALQLAVEDISSFVLGGHGDEMVPLVRYTYVGGIPVEKLLPQTQIEQLVERTRKGGGEIIELLGNGSAYYAPAAAIVRMMEAIVKDQRKVMPIITYLQGEYQVNNACIGVPVVLGGNGIESVIELNLNEEEQKAFNHSVHQVYRTLSYIK